MMRAISCATATPPTSVAHYTFDHRNFDGFIFPTHRRVVQREPDGQALLTAPSIFRLDIESVVLS
jgi:hypothetical protein